jgi:alkanesulfonate monooxygenase SsuD/methylene tetrahydromethanopterin reductase-like flavin-dependent oxidoreductase (luciferase family)
MTKPALSFAAVPGRRRATIELAQQIEQRGFAGLYCPSFGDGLALCEALALATKTIEFGTSIANIYTRHAYDYAQTAAFIHEISGGRFRFGIGVSHAPTNAWLGLPTGKPLADMRRFVGDLRTGAARTGDLPPVVLAALRRKMVALAGELGDGAVWANAARSHMPASLQALPAGAQRDGFFVGNMIPTCVATTAPPARRSCAARCAATFSCPTTSSTGSKPATKMRCTQSSEPSPSGGWTIFFRS